MDNNILTTNDKKISTVVVVDDTIISLLEPNKDITVEDSTNYRARFVNEDECYIDGVYSSETNVIIPQCIRKDGKLYVVTTISQPWEGTRFNGSNINSISLPNTIKIIEPWVFQGCLNLTSISLPISLTNIGDGAFSGSGLKSIEIPKSINVMGERIFMDCQELEDITLASNYIKIPSYTFTRCFALTEIILPEGLQEIENNAFEQTALTNIIIPNTVTDIQEKAFFNCLELEEIKLSENIVNIGNDAFRFCSNVYNNITIPRTIESIGSTSFESFASIGHGVIYIPADFTNIGTDAFNLCYSLITY